MNRRGQLEQSPGSGAVVWWASGFYLAFLLIGFMGARVSSWVTYLYFAWPYSSLLAFQKFINPDSILSAVLVSALGGAVVAAVAYILRNRIASRSPATAAIVGLGYFVGSVTILALGSQLLARALGWPYGE